MKVSKVNTAPGLMPAKNLEREKHLRLLYELLPSLSDEKVIALYFRFWERLLIEDIAKILGRSWDETDQLIESSINELRGGFLTHQLGAKLFAA